MELEKDILRRRKEKYMNYRETIIISASKATFIDKALQSKNMMGEDDILSFTVRFADGIEMDIKLCGAQGEEPWTEAVLFKDGQEICCSEPGVMCDGPWTLECDGNTYTAIVVMEKPDKEKEKEKTVKKMTTTTRRYRQCGGTEFAFEHKVSDECVVDGSGRLIRFLCKRFRVFLPFLKSEANNISCVDADLLHF